MKVRVSPTARHRCQTCGQVFKRGKAPFRWHPARNDGQSASYTITCPGCGAPAVRPRNLAKE